MSHKELIHGGDLASAAARYPNIRTWTDFSANVNPFGMPPGVESALARAIRESERYPDPACRALRETIAAFEGVRAEFVLCGGGATDLLYRAMYALRPKRVLLPAPTFQEYELAVSAAGGSVRIHSLGEVSGFSPEEDIFGTLRGCDLMVLCNPNNPTGALTEPALLEKILVACREAGTTLIIDECFLDFLVQPDRHSLKHRLLEYDRLLLLRAFTKIFALPGVRLGHLLCADAALLKKIDEAGPTWSVSVPAQAAGIAACAEGEYLQASREKLAALRPMLQEALGGCGLRVVPGCANFILFYTPDTALAEKLMARGILIRDCRGFRGLGPGFFRVAVRGEDDNTRLIQAIKECSAV